MSEPRRWLANKNHRNPNLSENPNLFTVVVEANNYDKLASRLAEAEKVLKILSDRVDQYASAGCIEAFSSERHPNLSDALEQANDYFENKWKE